MPNAHAYPIPHDLFTQEVPPSPTLTDPDMILPYRPVHASSPTPLASSPILQVSLPVRPDSAVSLSSSQPDHDAPVEVGIATTVRMSSRAIPPVSTGYDGYEHGAPLSDIGEEETPKSKGGRRINHPSSPTPTGRPSHTLQRTSTQSSSSSTGSDLGDWENFDTSKIMNERLAADVAKVPDEEVEELDTRGNSAVAANPEDEMALLNERAERILANARKRLTHMEDHLTKARHSILMTARSSPNMSEQHQPAGGLYRSISAAGASHRKPRQLYPIVRASSAAHTRGGSDVTINSGLKRLSIVPETRSASALEYGRRQESPQVQSPSARIGGYSPASNNSFNSPLRVLREEQSTPSTSKTSPESSASGELRINTTGASSKEDVSAITSSPTVAVARSSSAMSSRSRELREQMSDLRARISELKGKAQADSLRRQSMQSIRTSSPFTDAQTPEKWYTSTPEYKEAGSPLNTNAGQGWSPSRSQKPVEIQITPVTPQAQKFAAVEQPATDDSRLLSEARTDKNTPSLHRAVDLRPDAHDEVMSIIQESMYEDAAQELEDEEPVAASQEEQIYLNEVLEESLQEAEPELTELTEHIPPVDSAAERHEDRVDAFDYENMFLHSALGNYTGTGVRSDSPTGSDDSSTTTTRVDLNTPTADDAQGDTDSDADLSTEESSTPVQQSFHMSTTVRRDPSPSLVAPTKPWMKAVRSNSMDSVSTVATFATAVEGGGAQEEVDGMPNEILHWGTGGGPGFPRPPASPQHEKRPPAGQAPSLTGRYHQGPNRTPHIVHAPASLVSNGIVTTPTRLTAATRLGQLQLAQGKAHNEGTVDHPANTEILMESLVKLADPDFKVADGQQGKATFSDVDKGLVLDLLRAVGAVCNDILKAEMTHEVRAAKVLRRRLDEARKLLEGQAAE